VTPVAARHDGSPAGPDASPSAPPEIPGALTAGQQAFVAGLSEEQRARLGAASAGRRAELLAPFAAGFDAATARVMTAELPRASVLAPRLAAPASAREAIERVAGGDPTSIGALAELLAQDFGTERDRNLWGAFHSLGEQLWRGEVVADAVLDAHRQGTGPRAKNGGAVFTTALKRHGWHP
jgi:hypothetical protein